MSSSVFIQGQECVSFTSYMLFYLFILLSHVLVSFLSAPMHNPNDFGLFVIVGF